MVRGEVSQGRDARSGSNYASCIARRLRPLTALPVAGLLTGGDIFFYGISTCNHVMLGSLHFAPLQQAIIPIFIAEQCSDHFL